MAYIYDQFGSMRRIAHDDTDGTYTLAAEQVVDGLIEENKRLRENQTGKENFRLEARVPAVIAEKAMKEGWFHDDDAWKRWLNNPDNRDFRVNQGRI